MTSATAADLKEMFDLAKSKLPEKPGSKRNLSVRGSKFLAHRDADGSIRLTGLEMKSKTPPLRVIRSTRIGK